MMIRLVHVALVAALGLGCTGPRAAADVLYSQPYDGSSPGAVSQVFPDFPDFSSKSFDDVEVTSPGWRINRVTIFGQEQGDRSQNVSVHLAFTATADFDAPAVLSATGTEDHLGNLIFQNIQGTLAPGSYWITAWVERPELTGGQWFWSQTQPVTGSEYIFHNPGGGLGFGTSPIPGSTISGTPADLAFRIEGSSVPEPLSLTLLTLGGLGLAHRISRRRNA